jgi:flavin reductase (DIM6/NTAB) family NADH-FMN oxidoreductase RutF
MKEINYLDALRIANEKLAGNGVFLTVGGEKPNTMTIGWASIGYMWRKPVFTALVRPQRHTFEMIKKAGCFTVSVPTTNELKKELLFAGTKSGRDYDKFDGHGLTAAAAQEVDAPIVKECGLHFECRTLLTDTMPGEQMDAGVLDRCYPARDFHDMFFGEIVACYATDEEFARKYAR